MLYVWNFSFISEFGIGLFFYLIFLFIVLLIGLVISIFIDIKQSTKVKYYFIITIIQLLFIWLISNPIREWQIENSKHNGVAIIEIVEAYKERNGSYPKSLIELENEANIDLPIRTSIGTRYNYELYENDNYSLRFKSYYGYDYHYNKVKKEWYSAD